MSREEPAPVKVTVIDFVESTDKAELVKLKDRRELWVPVSVCVTIHKEPDPTRIGKGHQRGWIKIEEWFARKKDLL